MARVTGIGGVFFKGRDEASLRDWYRKHLGLDIQPWGGVALLWNQPAPTPDGATVFTIFPSSSSYFPGPFMVNFRVADLEALRASLRQEGCDVDEKTDSSEFGKFGWVTDPEGNRIELWEPPSGGLPG